MTTYRVLHRRSSRQQQSPKDRRGWHAQNHHSHEHRDDDHVLSLQHPLRAGHLHRAI